MRSFDNLFGTTKCFCFFHCITANALNSLSIIDNYALSNNLLTMLADHLSYNSSLEHLNIVFTDHGHMIWHYLYTAPYWFLLGRTFNIPVVDEESLRKLLMAIIENKTTGIKQIHITGLKLQMSKNTVKQLQTKLRSQDICVQLTYTKHISSESAMHSAYLSWLSSSLCCVYSIKLICDIFSDHCAL